MTVKNMTHRGTVLKERTDALIKRGEQPGENNENNKNYNSFGLLEAIILNQHYKRNALPVGVYCMGTLG